MYHNILTQKEQPEYRTLKRIVKLLLEFIESDSIYFSKSVEESKIGILTVIVSKKSPHYYDEIYEYLWKVFKKHNQFSFCIFDRDCVKDNVKNGNLFFIVNCKESELVYSKANHKPVLKIKKVQLKKLLRKSNERFKMWMAESNTIGRDLKYHRRSDNHLMALYIIHQQFRYLFINVSWLLTGEWTIDESIKVQQEHVSMFSNSLGKVFDPEKKEEWILLKMLDHACKVIQWGKEVKPINEEVVTSASEKLEWMQKEVRTIYQQYTEKTKIIFEENKNTCIV